MRLPNPDKALVEEQKITEYLLSASHPDGAGKAEFFARFGYRRSNWRVFAEALRQHGRRHEVRNTVESPFGVRYTIDGEIETPDGRNPWVRTVWIIEKGKDIPRLVTAHPVQEAT